MVSIAAVIAFGQLTISTEGGISATRNRFFNAVIDRYYDEYDKETIRPQSIERAGQGHILFPSGRANRMVFFEHIDMPSFGQTGWPRFRLKAYELKNGQIVRLGVWTLKEGKTNLTEADGTLARFICKDQPKCELPVDRIPELRSFFTDRDPWACYQLQVMNGNIASFIGRHGEEISGSGSETDFGMTSQERRYLKQHRGSAERSGIVSSS